MKSLVKSFVLAAVHSTLYGFAGSVYNKEKNCNYTYFLHHAIPFPKIFTVVERWALV